MKIKQGLLATIAGAAIMMTSLYSVAMASPGGHHESMQMSQEKMHEHMKARLDKLAQRLEIKSSQQAVWEEFAKSVEVLADRNVKKPGDDADAATISRYQSDRATEFSKKLTVVADATAKLQAALTENQQKTLNQVARRFLHMDHGWNKGMHRRGKEGSHEEHAKDKE